VTCADWQGLRLFCDRLVTSAEQKWCSDLCDEVALKHFPSVATSALERPIMYSKWLSRHYSSADREELRKHIQVSLHGCVCAVAAC
jgi:dynein heavy chain 1